MLEEILMEKLERKYREDMNRPFTWKGLIKEICIIGLVVIVIPVTIVSVELFFHHCPYFASKAPI